MNKLPKFAAVITTINNPNSGMETLLGYAQKVEAPVIVVGDTKTPDTWESTDFEYLSISKQESLFSEFANIIPTRHYARKNLGYLQARLKSVDWIYETDDDNVPTSSPFEFRELSVDATTYNTDSLWLNVYEVFGYSSEFSNPPLIWPRGFDLRSLKFNATFETNIKAQSPVQQGLANGDPDVDAIYRLVLGNFVNFNETEPVALKIGQVCPTNSQTTWWHSSVHQLMYLPSTCTFRLTDILRGFVAWRILQERGEVVTFHSPIVRQDRNEHDLLRDFSDETELFLHSDSIIQDLLDLDLSNLSTSQKLVACYQVLENKGVIKHSELRILESWNSFFS